MRLNETLSNKEGIQENLGSKVESYEYASFRLHDFRSHLLLVILRCPVLATMIIDALL